MSLLTAVASAEGLDGREAALQATHRALDRLGSANPALGILFVSPKFPIQPVVTGASSLLGNTPLWGCHAHLPFTAGEQKERSVVVALLGGSDLKARAQWWQAEPAHAELEAWLHNGPPDPQVLLLAGDGAYGSAAHLSDSLKGGSPLVAGCLASGELYQARTCQIGGNQAGAGGLAAALLSGHLRIGVGAAHGWQPVGLYFRATRTQDLWVRAFEEGSAAEAYARAFGYPASDWCFPPLAELVRLYPLGIEDPDDSHLLLRSPLHVEADGSLRMNAPVPEGSVCHLMAGEREKCLEAARQAVRQARAGLGSARPALAVVLADVAWQLLFEAQPGLDLQALRAELGEDVPIAGGYTLGQIAPTLPGGPPQLLNQHLLVILFAEA